MDKRTQQQIAKLALSALQGKKTSGRQKLTLAGIILAVVYGILQHIGILPGPTSPRPPVEGSYDTKGLPAAAGSFGTAKRDLYETVYKGHASTFYCDCEFDPDQRDVDRRACGVSVRENANRANRIEAEHIMPAHRFGGHLECWQNPDKVCPGKDYSGRTCCEKAHPVYEIAQNDLHNLVPAVGEINGDRSNYGWVEELGSHHQHYGKCEIRVDLEGDKAAPPPNRRGDIARAYLYMERTYGERLQFQLSSREKAQYTAWAEEDPPDPWEYERNTRIAKLQGLSNSFVTAGLVAGERVQDRRSAPGFSCDERKTCGQMTSCEEATYHLHTCGNTGLDRDGDGVPCASVCGG